MASAFVGAFLMLHGYFSFFDPFSMLTSDLADDFIGPVCFFGCFEHEVWVLL